ncbi:hypothetical protein [Streptomyces roseifaciens]|uniref:hypothetical protein n=1 Tax=Streptomyces roseifaciens TaxID=1488406 RepID=UPI00071801BA|nr:hypothetical protein [Streptomyces roseifaciens]
MAGPKTDLELARQEITLLRAARDKLTEALRRQLGQQFDQVAVGDRVTRVNELTAQDQRLSADLVAAQQATAELEAQLTEA